MNYDSFEQGLYTTTYRENVRVNSIKIDNVASSVYYDKLRDVLWVPTFVADKSASGKLIGYIKKDQELVEEYTISIPNRTQSAIVLQDKIYLSRSYSRDVLSSNYISQIDVYDYSEECLAYPTEIIVVPPMLEQIQIENNEIYLLFESGADEYVRNSSDKKCLYPINKIIKILYE